MNEAPPSRILQSQMDHLKFKIEAQILRGDAVKAARAEIAKLRVQVRDAKLLEPKPPSPTKLAKSITAKQRQEIVTRHEAGRPTDGGGPSIEHWTDFMHQLIEDVTGVDVYRWSSTKCDAFWRICLKD